MTENIIGIPRALNFYEQYPFLYGFFTKLGINIVLSDITTKKTLAQGSSRVVTETCLPIKVYVGHVLNLINKGVRNIYIPSIQSIAPKIYNCSKVPFRVFEDDFAQNNLKAVFKLSDLDSLGYKSNPLAYRASAGMLAYIWENMKEGFPKFERINSI